MPTPCSRCKSAGSECRVDLTSGRCSRCIKGKRVCDLVVTAEDLAKLDRLRAELRSRVDELVDEEADVELEILSLWKKQEELLGKKKVIRERRLMLKAEYGSLTKREKETMSRELASIDELSRLEEQAAASVSSASGEPVVPNVLSPPAEWIDDFPAEWSLAQLVDFSGGNGVGGPEKS